MKKTDIAHLACRILAIYIFFRALQHLSQLPLFFQGYTDPLVKLQMVLAVLVPFLILAGFSAALWIFTGRLVRCILPGNEDDAEQFLIRNTKDIYVIAFAVVGVAILAVAIPGIFQIISNITILNTQAAFTNQSILKIQTTFAIIEKIVQLAIGFGLILGSKGLSELLSKIREL